jgi:hypothetical protein
VSNWNPQDEDGRYERDFGPYELGADPKRDALNCELYWAWKKFDQRCRERGIFEGTKQMNFHKASYAAHLRKKLNTDLAYPEASYDSAREAWNEAHMPAPPCAGQ